MSIEELSDRTLYRGTQSKMVDISDEDDTSSESYSESVDRIYNSVMNEYANKHIIEDVTNSDCNTIENVYRSTCRGLRLVENVEYSLVRTYFEVTIHIERKFMQKQIAC